MPRDILIQVITENLWGYFLLIAATHLFHWYIILKLGFRFIGARPLLKTITPGIIIGTLSTIFGRLFIPDFLFGLLVLLLFSGILCYYSKNKFLNSIWSGMFVLILSGFGTLLFINPLRATNPYLVDFFNSPLGCAVGTISETLFPAIFLLAFRSLNILGLFPLAKNRIKPVQIIGIIPLILIFSGINYMFLVYLDFVKLVPTVTVFNTLLFVFIIMLASLLSLLVFNYFTQKQQEQERLQYQQEQLRLQNEKLQLENEQLRLQLHQGQNIIDTISCEQRIYRDHLQTINLLATSTKNKPINDYIKRVVREFDDIQALGIDNPILASIILSHRIRALENGVRINLTNQSSFKETDISPLKLGSILDEILGLFVATELNSRALSRQVDLHLSETKDNYTLVFENSPLAIYNIQKGSAIEADAETLKQIESLGQIITQLGGIAAFTVESGYVVNMKITLPKQAAVMGLQISV